MEQDKLLIRVPINKYKEVGLRKLTSKNKIEKVFNILKQKAKIKTASVGLITDPQHAQNIVSSKKSDFVFLGRELLREPYWPIKAAQSLNQTKNLSIPGQYYLGWRDLLGVKFRGI